MSEDQALLLTMLLAELRALQPRGLSRLEYWQGVISIAESELFTACGVPAADLVRVTEKSVEKLRERYGEFYNPESTL